MYKPINLLDNKLGGSFFNINRIPNITRKISNAKYILPTKKIAKLLTILPIIPVPKIPIIPSNITITPIISLLYSNLFLFLSFFVFFFAT